ncbi:hypothetical protein PAXINDRAFT_8172 [Paxillus involutus ATCC 200175]|nr:hypothetical protein PAXINDRAFT_8172 [Paxillus involutus ATCC 200175]
MTMTLPTFPLLGCNRVPGVQALASPSLFKEPPLKSGTLDEVVAHLTFYESNDLLRALSYRELIRRWTRALLLIHSAKLTGKDVEETQKSLSKIQLEFDDHEKDIVKIIRQDTYSHMHLKFVSEVGRRLHYSGRISVSAEPNASL